LLAFLKNTHEIFNHKKDGKKIANAIFMLTDDVPMMAQKYGHENSDSRFHRRILRTQFCP